MVMMMKSFVDSIIHLVINLRRKSSKSLVIESDGTKKIIKDKEGGEALRINQTVEEMSKVGGELRMVLCVCLLKLSEGDDHQTRRLPCLHVLHKVCVSGWLDFCCKTCPLHRFKVEGDSDSLQKKKEFTMIWFSSIIPTIWCVSFLPPFLVRKRKSHLSLLSRLSPLREKKNGNLSSIFVPLLLVLHLNRKLRT